MASVSAQAAAETGRCFAARLRRFGAQPAVLTEDDTALSYAELADRVDAFAARLGETPRLLLIEARNELEALIAYLAGLAGGHSVLMAADASDRLVGTFRPDALYRAGAEGWTLTLTAPEAGLHPDLALLLSTSGTTGATKLVRLSAAALDANADAIADYLGIGPGARAITTLPIHYSYGLSVVNSHLAHGGTLLLTGRSLLEPELRRQLDAQQATSLAGVPYTFDLLDRIGFWDQPHPSLTTITQAGGRLAPDRVARIGAWAQRHGVGFFVMYGQTEATARIAYLPPDHLETAPDCIGVAIPGGALSLRAADGTTVDSPETEGELVYTGANVMMGYAQTRADLARGAELDELATGDLAVRTAAGLYRITGRASRIVKPFGLRISLDEIEAVLARQGIAAAVTGTDALIAIAAIDPPSGLATDLATRLKLPDALFDLAIAAEVPRLPSGKPDYRAILEAAEARAASRPAVPRGSEVAAIYARAFNGRPIDPSHSFLELGGDSLSYVRLSLDLEALIGDLPEHWESRSIAELQQAVPVRAASARSWLRRVDTEVVLRAIAIIAIIINHASTYPTGGGSEVLMLLVGYSLARFQSDRFSTGQGPAIVRDLFVKVMLPYLGILMLYSVLRKPVAAESFFLVSSLSGRTTGFLEPFWFLEALFQTYIVFMLLFLMPVVRRVFQADPFRLGLWLVAAGFLVKFGALLLFDHALTHYNRTLDATFLLVAIGWCVWFARSWQQRAIVSGIGLVLVALTAGLVPPLAVWRDFPASVWSLRAMWLAAGLALLLWVPRLTVPTALHGCLTQVSAAGYYIYLSHGILVYAVLTRFTATPLILTVILACALGIALGWASAHLGRALSRG